MTKRDLMVLDHLSQFVSEHKKVVVDKVLNSRTRHITVVLEDIFQSQNASAVIRTTECLGLQDIHIVEQLTKYETNPRVLKGANKWITFHRYDERGLNNTKSCFDRLRRDGYRILVADPGEGGTSVHNISVDSKLALVFGNELRGVSKFALDHADERITIPMYGFTESLNISVSVAICLSALVTKLHATDLFSLPDEDKIALKLAWYRKIVRRSELIEREFLRTID